MSSQYKPKSLELVRAGAPILREVMPRLSREEILSNEVQELIEDMYYTVREQRGVGLAAPQVGVPLALSVISIRPTLIRPWRELTEFAIINPDYEGIGEKVDLKEGCISNRRSDGGSTAIGTSRYREIEARWVDREGNERYVRRLGGLAAHVFQHETDHLNGKVIF